MYFFLAPPVGLEPTTPWLWKIRSEASYLLKITHCVIFHCHVLYLVFRWKNSSFSTCTSWEKQTGDILANARSIYLLRKFDITSLHSVTIWYKFLFRVAARQHIASKIYRVRSTYSKFVRNLYCWKKRTEFFSTLFSWAHSTKMQLSIKFNFYLKL